MLSIFCLIVSFVLSAGINGIYNLSSHKHELKSIHKGCASFLVVSLQVFLYAAVLVGLLSDSKCICCQLNSVRPGLPHIRLLCELPSANTCTENLGAMDAEIFSLSSTQALKNCPCWIIVGDQLKYWTWKGVCKSVHTFWGMVKCGHGGVQTPNPISLLYRHLLLKHIWGWYPWKMES